MNVIFQYLSLAGDVLEPPIMLLLYSGYLQSLYGVYSLRIEHVGVRRPPSDDVQIHGIANPSAFRKVLTHCSCVKVIPKFSKYELLYQP